jgi:hypothetical protein
MIRDLYNNSTVKTLLAAKRQSGVASASLVVETGTAVDMKGEGGKCLLLVSIGATATATMLLTIQESVDNSTWTTLRSTNYDTTGNEVVDLTPSKRYIRATATLSATGAVDASYVDCVAYAVIYDERYRPSNVA